MTRYYYLKEGDKIRLEDECGCKKDFTIISKCAEGASVICYNASYGKQTGILKEYYPMDVRSLKRNEQNQLFIDSENSDEEEKFYNKVDKFIEPFSNILDLQKNNKDIKICTPHMEMYRGCPGNDKIGTFYIWSVTPEYITFEKICKDIQADSEENHLFNITRILKSIEALIECICIFHKAGFVHRDIKPENFGFLTRGNELLPQTLNLFDIDTICSVYDVEIPVESEGYGEYEIGYENAENLTDIFSIGATLFSAISFSDKNQEDTRYQYDFYNKIEEIVNSSLLIRAVELNVHNDFKDIIINVLKRSLAPRESRYMNCESMLEDVRKALECLVPVKYIGKNIDIQDIAKYYNSRKKLNINNTILNHLYTNPIYNPKYKSSGNKKTMNILVIGHDWYSHKFMDLVLPILQIPGKTVNLTVISDNDNNKEKYLKSRPEFTRFFNVDGSVPNNLDSYGEVSFLVHDYSDMLYDINEYLTDKFGNNYPDYIFISLGNDSNNIALARKIKINTNINVIIDEAGLIKKYKMADIHPVCVNEDISNTATLKELERMAFNVHLVWEKNLNVKFRKKRKDFLKQYNYYSNMSFAVAIGYKLHGIEIDYEDSRKNAKAYKQYIESNIDLKNELIYYEHRRWTAEKVCLGYSQITDLEECGSGATKDEKRKRHICITRSTKKQPLSYDGYWYDKKKKQAKTSQWNKPSDGKLNELDELDQISVKLHLMHKKNADKVKNDFFIDSFGTDIRNQIECDKECLVAFWELFACMKEIWNNQIKQVSRYKGLLAKFSELVKKSIYIDNQIKKMIYSLLNSLDSRFYPLLASQEYCNYKKYDAVLVEAIPFILSYSNLFHVVVPYQYGDNNKIFENLASITIINPSYLIYVCYCSDAKELEKVRSTIPYISNFMKEKEIRAKVEFIIGHRFEIENTSFWEKEIINLSSKRVSRVTFVSERNEIRFSSVLKKKFNERKKDKINYIAEYNKTPLAMAMLGEKIYDDIPCFSFSSSGMKFENVEDTMPCDVVSYFHAEPFMTVSDVFSLSKTKCQSNNPEFFSEYKDLWVKYSENSGAWKNLCRVLKNHSENDLLVKFLNDKKSSPEIQLEYVIPFACKNSVLRIIDVLKNEGFAEMNSKITGKNSNSCKVYIYTCQKYKELYMKLFANPHIFMNDEYIYFNVNKKNNIVEVYYNDLVASNVKSADLFDNGYKLLDYLNTNNYIYNLVVDKPNKKVSFIYSTPQIKDLLTLEGRFLEIYVYHHAKSTGLYDDIRSSFKVEWEKEIGENEFDCILTKGFKTFFVECKATNDIKFEYYTKLFSLAYKFGVNAEVVLIADTDEKNQDFMNELMRHRGEDGFNIITISDREKIQNIGYTLYDLI